MGNWDSLGWTYDGVGNRLTEGSTSYSYVQGTNKLSGVGGQSYSFDNAGNTTADGSRGYTYNQNQRLITASTGTTTANYAYNGSGQRTKKVVGSTTTIYHYSQSGQLIAESDSSGTFSAEYVYLNGQPLAKIEGTSTYYYHNDHLGTPQKMTDASGTVVWAVDYKPFGEATITVSTITNNLRFPGQYFDAQTGLNYNYFRDYNTILGRYLTPDPALLPTGETKIPFLLSFNLTRKDPQKLNPFVYVENNSIRWKDVMGLQANNCKLQQCIADAESNHKKCLNKIETFSTGLTVICYASIGIQTAFGDLPGALLTGIGCITVIDVEPYLGQIICNFMHKGAVQRCHAEYDI